MLEFEERILSKFKLIPYEIVEVLKNDDMKEKINSLKWLRIKFIALSLIDENLSNFINVCQELSDEYQAEIDHRRVTFDEPMQKYLKNLKIQNKNDTDTNGEIELRSFTRRM